MNLLAAFRREERKIEKQVEKLQQLLDTIKEAREAVAQHGKHDKRRLSKAARLRISRAQKARWRMRRAPKAAS